MEDMFCVEDMGCAEEPCCAASRRCSAERFGLFCRSPALSLVMERRGGDMSVISFSSRERPRHCPCAATTPKRRVLCACAAAAGAGVMRGCAMGTPATEAWLRNSVFLVAVAAGRTVSGYAPVADMRRLVEPDAARAERARDTDPAAERELLAIRLNI